MLFNFKAVFTRRILYYLTTHRSLSLIRHGFASCSVNYKKGCTRLAATSDKSSPVTCPWSVVISWYSSFYTTKTWYSWNIAESGVKLKHNKSNQITWRISLQAIMYHVGESGMVTDIHMDQWSKCLPNYQTDPPFYIY